MKKILITTTLLIITFFICLPCFTSTSIAATTTEAAGYKIDVSIPGGPIAGTEVSLAEYIKYIYIFGLSLIGIAALGSLVYGGFMYMMSDTVVSKEDAKKYIWAAISGLLLGLAAFLILNTINPDLTSLIPPELDDLSELKEPVPPTDCTDDANACSACEYCDKVSEDKSVCKDTCASECSKCEGDECVPKDDGAECKEYEDGTCQNGACKPPDKDCMGKDEWGCTTWPPGCCEPNVCYFDRCEEPKDPDCIEGGGCRPGTNCCGVCYKGKCVDCYPLGADCTGDGECCSGSCDDSNACEEQIGA